MSCVPSRRFHSVDGGCGKAVENYVDLACTARGRVLGGHVWYGYTL